MKENAKLMRCGACGSDTMKIYSEQDNYEIEELLVECTECKSISVIRISRPIMHIEWDDDELSEGILSFF